MCSKLVSAFVLILSVNVCAFCQQRLSKAKAPEPATVSGYSRAHCAALPNGVRICKCISEAEDVFVAEKGGQIKGKWPTTAAYGETSDFDVLVGDLDGDGAKELIVANHDGSSQGMMVSYWTISIFPGLENFERALVFSVEEYGSFGTFVQVRGGVQILATKWIWSKALRGRRGVGLYLTGRMWRYQDGRLLAVANRPLMARRYLNSFERERAQTEDSPYIPYSWFKSPQAETRRIDPLIDYRVKESLEGVIGDITTSPASGESTISITFQGSAQSPSTVSYRYPVAPDENTKNAFMYIGEASTNIIYPDGYRPVQPVKWLKGRRCKLVTYDGEFQSENLKVLWLL
jgi:hypothetical protein